MSLRDLFERWGLTEIKVTGGFYDSPIEPNAADRQAAWELYVELLTTVSVQPLGEGHGNETEALDSIHRVFNATREILKKQLGCTEFAKVAVLMLNQVVRPFAAEWHRRRRDGAFEDPGQRAEFRSALVVLQGKMCAFAHVLAQLADVQDLLDLVRQ